MSLHAIMTPTATIAANDTCEFGTCPGCTDPEACNYNPTVTEDDGSCLYMMNAGCAEVLVLQKERVIARGQ